MVRQTSRQCRGDMSDPILQPCPFCGGAAELVECGNDEEERGGPWEWWLAGCKPCDVWRSDNDGNKDAAVKLWNTRSKAWVIPY